jgi:hypothetical protein
VNVDEPTSRTFAVRALKWLALFIALVVAYRIGAGFGARSDSTAEQPPPPQPTPASTYDPSKGFPRPDAPRVEDPRQPEARAVAARAEAIRRDATAILAECQRVAGGDWDKWRRDTAPYRDNLKAKIDALSGPAHPENANRPPLLWTLEGLNGFPLFEAGPRVYLNALYDDRSLDEFRKDRAVVAAHRWLRERGIDLIFVPVPKMVEVYPEHFLDPCPADGIIAPHIRQALWALLNDGVEVVDGLRLFRAVRDTDAEYLYNTADSHWAPRGMRVMAKEIADRIERYNFGARARYGLPIVRTAPGQYVFMDLTAQIGAYGMEVLSPEQRKRAGRAQTTAQVEVRMSDGRRPPEDPKSPVHVIGHSYVTEFREQLIKELNMLITTGSSDLQTTESFADFARMPQILEHCRVLVWITTDHHMTKFKPMPAPILKALESGK